MNGFLLLFDEKLQIFFFRSTFLQREITISVEICWVIKVAQETEGGRKFLTGFFTYAFLN